MIIIMRSISYFSTEVTEMDAMHFTREERVVLWGVSYTMVILSLVGSITVLYRVLKRKPRGIFTSDHQGTTSSSSGGPGEASRFFDTLVSSTS